MLGFPKKNLTSERGHYLIIKHCPVLTTSCYSLNVLLSSNSSFCLSLVWLENSALSNIVKLIVCCMRHTIKSFSEASNTEPNKNHKILIFKWISGFLCQLQVFCWPKSWSKAEFAGNQLLRKVVKLFEHRAYKHWLLISVLWNGV